MYRDKAARETYKVGEGRTIVKVGLDRFFEMDLKRKSIRAKLPAEIEI